MYNYTCRINSRPYPLLSFIILEKYIHKHVTSHHLFIFLPSTSHGKKIDRDFQPLSLAKGNEALRYAGSTLGITILIDQALPEERLGPFFCRLKSSFFVGQKNAKMPRREGLPLLADFYIAGFDGTITAITPFKTSMMF